VIAISFDFIYLSPQFVKVDKVTITTTYFYKIVIT
jgi:hypothetical protein